MRDLTVGPATAVGRLSRSSSRAVSTAARPPNRHAQRHLAESLARHLVPVDGIEVPIHDGSPAPADTGGRLAMALLAYVALITTVVTLLPFEFTLPTEPRVILSGGLFDIVANVGLFVPLGFLYA